jgi:hypothetical protein
MNFYDLEKIIEKSKTTQKIELSEALSHVSDKDFIKTVIEADKMGENKMWVAAKLGCTYDDVRTRINRLISRGFNMPTLMKRKDTYDDYEKKYIEITKEIIRFKKNGERLPIKLKNWLVNIKRAKIGVLRPTRKGDLSTRRWYPILDKIAAEEGYPDLFTVSTMNRKPFSDDDWANTNLIINLLKQKKPLTSELQQWIITQSLKKNKNDDWYPMLDRIAEIKGYTGLFNNPNWRSLKSWLILNKHKFSPRS